MGAATQAMRALFDHRPWNWATMATWTLGYALSYLLLQLVLAAMEVTGTHRVEGDEAISLAIDLRALPQNADPDVWRPCLERRRRQLPWVGWATTAVLFLFTGLVAWAAAVGNAQAWTVWALVALFAASSAAPRAWAASRARVVERLLSQLV